MSNARLKHLLEMDRKVAAVYCFLYALAALLEFVVMWPRVDTPYAAAAVAVGTTVLGAAAFREYEARERIKATLELFEPTPSDQIDL